MVRRAWFPLFTLTLTLSLCAFAAGQTDAPAQTYASRNSTVRVDVIVTDAQGRPIANLKREDVEVIDGGTAQPIETLEFKGAAPAAARGARPAVLPLDAPDTAKTGRLLALFLDEYHVSAGANTDRVRDTLLRFVDERLKDDDLVAVMKPLDSVVSIRLTRNRDEIRSAVEGFSGVKGDYTPRSSFEASVISHAPAAATTARAQVVMSALHALATYIGAQREGRKAIVLVSEGFSTEVPRNRIRLPDAQAIVRAAQRYDVALYAFNPAVAAAGPAAQPTADAAPEPEKETPVLRTVAEQTSGEATLDASGFDAGLQRVTRDLDAYYTLTFRPASSGDGRFHPIQVRVKRKGAQVRARSGYWTPSIEELRRAAASLAKATPAFRPKPLKISPLVQPWFRMTRGPDGRTRVQFRWEPKPPPAGVRARPQAAIGTLVLNALAPDGKPVFTGRISPARGGIDQSSPTEAVVDAEPGSLALEMSIEDTAERLLDTDARILTVPDLNGKKTVLGSAEILRTRTAVEFRAAVADLNALPTAVRVFSRSERLLIRAPAYGPGGVNATVSARLLNALGQPIFDVPEAGPMSSEGISQFDLLLSSLAPGEYRIELAARSGESDARESFGFRIIG